MKLDEFMNVVVFDVFDIIKLNSKIKLIKLDSQKLDFEGKWRFLWFYVICLLDWNVFYCVLIIGLICNILVSFKSKKIVKKWVIRVGRLTSRLEKEDGQDLRLT